MSEAGARRAAHYDANFLPQGVKAKSFYPWVKELQDMGRDPDNYRVGIIRSILVTDDLESDWLPIRESGRYRMKLYQRFFEESGEGFGENGEAVPQTWFKGTTNACIDQITEFVKKFGITDIVSMAVPPGLSVEHMAPSLERLFRDVVPQVKESLS